MVGLLGGNILSQAFGAAFSGIYADGVLTRFTLSDDGEGGGTATPTTEPCKVQRDATSEAMRAAEGATETDVRLLILQSGLSAPVDTDCQVAAYGSTYAIASAVADPASAYWECRGQLIRE